VRSTQPFILSEIVRLNSRLTPSRSVAFRKETQFSLQHGEFRGATIQTDDNLWKYPHDGLVKVLQTGKMDAYLPRKLALID
jgi:hypothetical protein